MDKKTMRDQLSMRGVPREILKDLSKFTKEAERYVFPKTFTIEQAANRLMGLLERILFPEELTLLENKLGEWLNKKRPTLRYLEEGYDSCQANREVSKVISQLICIGGIYQETRDYLGLELTSRELRNLLNLDFESSQSELKMLGQITSRIGSNQEFLFPGVTKSYEEVPDIETLALEARVYIVSDSLGVSETAIKLIRYSDLSFRKMEEFRWISSPEQKEVKEVLKEGFLAFAISRLRQKYKKGAE